MELSNKIQVVIDRYVPELEGKKFLLAVSGGADSVVLAYLFYHLRLNFSIAHCNFKLRATESDDDALFVKELAAKLDAPFFSVEFDTQKLAEERGISIQMSARDLRYYWFKEIITRHKLDYIVTAHQKNDQIETFFINLLRGTGADGLSGMKILDQQLFRPLLDISKEEILNYATKHQIKWREDSSNQSTEYIRNKIRLEIIPLFKEINPSFEKTMMENMNHINDARVLYQEYLQQKTKYYLVKNEFGFQLNLREISKEKSPAFILFEILKNFGFNYSTVKDILADHVLQSGLKFFSATYRVVDHRGTLLITRLAPKGVELYTIDTFTEQTDLPLALKFSIQNPDEDITGDLNFAQLDYDEVSFPLTIRRWHEGDVFKPLGMRGRKKVSDFFIDQKFSIPEKENTWLLCSADKIVWVIGYRIDDRFKVTDRTKKVLKIEYLN